MGRVGLDWVEGIFLPNSPWWVKKNSTQSDLSHKSNPIHMGRVGRVEPMGLTNFIIIIIIKLNRKKNININILKKSKN